MKSNNDENVQKIINIIYPVGSIVYNWNKDFNPSSVYGGTWEQIKGSFLWAGEDAETAGATGGEKTHNLTQKEVPQLTCKAVGIISGPKQPNGTKKYDFKLDTYWQNVGTAGTTTGSDSFGVGTYYVNASGGSVHNNMPPYTVVWCWRRTG